MHRKKSKVALLYNYKSPELKEKLGEYHDYLLEWDDDETIEAIRSAIALKYDAHLVPANLDCIGKLQKIKPDLVFNIAEGEFGPNREAYMPAILEMLNIPFTGSDVGTLANAHDKNKTKIILSYNKVNTPEFICINNLEDLDKINILKSEKTYIIKPCWEGSSKGITDKSIIHDLKEIKPKIKELLDRYKQPVLVEEFLEGKEFTVAILGNMPSLTVLPIVELDFSELPKGSNPIYSYEAKWVWDTKENPLSIFKCPAAIDDKLKEAIGITAKKAFAALGCRDWCRIDVRLDNKQVPYILELNPLPGILPNPDSNSCFPKAARTAGIDYVSLIHKVIDLACKRYGLSLK